MPRELLVGIDVGSTRVKAHVFDLHGRELAGMHVATPWTRTATGAEADPADIYEAALGVTLSALALTPHARVVGIGVTGMAEAVALLGSASDAVAPTIAWYDSRGDVEGLRREIGPGRFMGTTGLPLSTKPTIMKLHWMRYRDLSLELAVCALSLPEYVAYRLGGEPVAELSLASRTGLFDVCERRWNEHLLEWAGVREGLFPELRVAGTPLGTVKSSPGEIGQLRGAIIAVGGHDHLCAAVGAGVLVPTEMLDDCGTAEAYVRATATLVRCQVIAAAANGLCVSCHVIPDHQAVLGSGPLGLVLGPVFDLLGREDQLEAVATAAECATSSQADDTLSFSFDDRTGRSCLAGIGPGSTPGRARALAIEEVLRGSLALYETVAHIGGPVESVTMTGGWAQVEPLLQRKCERFPGVSVAVTETGARGAALIAGRAAGVFPRLEDLPAPELTSPIRERARSRAAGST